MKKKILVIVGPTALGKTDLALTLAKKFKGELVACDSRQVYKGLIIGAGKGNESVRLYDIADPKKQYSLAKYVKDARAVIVDILKEGKLPIIVGGTGLYLKGLLGEYQQISTPPNNELRKKLDGLSVGELQSRVVALSPIVYSNMNDSDKKNKRRLIRKIEQLSMYGYINDQESNPKLDSLKTNHWDILKIGLSAPRPTINQLIDSRLLKRFSLGMVAEVEGLQRSGLSFKRMKELGLEYGVISEYLKGELTYDEMVEKLKNKIHQYAKRQLVWFKKDTNIKWFDITYKGFEDHIETKVRAWYDPNDDSQD